MSAEPVSTSLPVTTLVQKDDIGSDREDSLFSSEKLEENIVEISTPEIEDVFSEPKYSEEEIITLVNFIKDLTILYHLESQDWTKKCEMTIRYWLTEPSELLLVIFFNNGELVCETFIPKISLNSAMYFLREPGFFFSTIDFYDKIIFGTVNGHIESTILQVVQNAFAPVLLINSKKWPDNVRNDFSYSVHMFLAKIVDIHYQIHGLTILYVPRMICDFPVKESSQDKEFIKIMESIMVYWIKQIRTALDQDSCDDSFCPKDEYNFWKCRCENLLGLNYQLENLGIKHILKILTVSQSSYMQQFHFLVKEVVHKVEESKSNIEYLAVVIEPCKELANFKSPNEFLTIIPRILQLIWFVWLNSPNYNTPEKIIFLFRSLSNQIIFQCTEFIDMNIIFVRKETRKAINMLENCINCLNTYIKYYILIFEAHTELGKKACLNLERALIFNYTDSYIQRCKDTIEICEAMIVFGRYDETEIIPEPCFGTSKGQQFVSGTKKIELMFNDSLRSIEKVHYLIFDVQNAQWANHILSFRTVMKNIEVIIENLANTVFSHIANVEEGIESLASMYIFSKRKTLFSLFQSKTLQIYEMFREEILDTKQDIYSESELFLAGTPYYSGRAEILHLKKNRLQILKRMFDDASWMLACSISDEVFAQYKNLILSINERILFFYQKWLDHMGEIKEQILQVLNRPIFCKSISKPGLLECNIDRVIFQLFQEVNGWEVLGYEIPIYLKPIYQKSDTIQFVYECVLNIVQNHNKVITSLSSEERLLFKPLISKIEKKLAPGLTKLNWASNIDSEYIVECRSIIEELQDFIDDYKECNVHIVLICEKICNTQLLNLTQYSVMELELLEEQFNKYMANAVEVLIGYFYKITEYLLIVFEGLKEVFATVVNYWVRYINNFNRLIREAILISCKNSLKSLHEILHGDGIVPPNPLLKITINLRGNDVSFHPTLESIAKIITNAQNTCVEAVISLPQLSDKFHLEGIDDTSYANLIANDEECNYIQNQINLELQVAFNRLKDYMKTWEPFRDLWEVDKVGFIEYYEKRNPSAAMFNINIGRYAEIANNIQIQESFTNVYFFQINCSELKTALITHCNEWKQRLCMLLLKLTESKMDVIYKYIEKNTSEVQKEPENLSDMKVLIQLSAHLKEDILFQEKEFSKVSEQVIILNKYAVTIPSNVRVRYKMLPKKWVAYMEVLHQAQHMLDYSKVMLKDTKSDVTS